MLDSIGKRVSLSMKSLNLVPYIYFVLIHIILYIID